MRNAKHGMTLVELLLALSLTGMLLVAVSVAMQASTTSYRENEDLAAVTQTARAVLDRMMREIRTADAVDTTSTSVTIIPPEDGSGITEIRYALTEGELTYRVTAGSATTHVLISNDGDIQVSDFSVVREDGQNWKGDPCTKSVNVRLVLVVRGKSFPMSASASPRRNQTY